MFSNGLWPKDVLMTEEDDEKPAKSPKGAAGASAEPMRIQKYISRSGICSRREAEERIQEGRVEINGETATLGQVVTPGVDKVLVDGNGIYLDTRPIYILMNKPIGVVSTRKDTEGRPTVLDVVRKISKKNYLYPVGRLDANSEGLVFLTNDGSLAHRMMHPRYKLQKVYKVCVDSRLTDGQLNRMRRGVRLEDGPTLPAKVKETGYGPKGVWYELALLEGRNRQVRRMFALFGKNVQQLVRVQMGALKLEGLRPGDYRFLEKEEVAYLLEFMAASEKGEVLEVKVEKKSRVGWARAKRPVRGQKGGGRGVPTAKKAIASRSADRGRAPAKKAGARPQARKTGGGGRPGRSPGGRKRDGA